MAKYLSEFDRNVGLSDEFDLPDPTEIDEDEDDEEGEDEEDEEDEDD